MGTSNWAVRIFRCMHYLMLGGIALAGPAQAQCTAQQTADFTVQCQQIGAYFANLEATCVAWMGSHYACGYYPLPSQVVTIPGGLGCRVTLLYAPSQTTPLPPPACMANPPAPNVCWTSDTMAKQECDKCPVDPLTNPPFADACSTSLEKGHGVDIDGVCSQLDAKLNAQLQCFANKITAANAMAKPPIPYSGPTATIRTAAYQAHLQEVWNTLAKLDSLSDPAEIAACQSLRDQVTAEIGCNGGHCLDYPPADLSNHISGTAFDVSRETIQGLLKELTPLPPAPMTLSQKQQFQKNVISGWLASPAPCNLVWGGSFQNPDRVHFQLP